MFKVFALILGLAALGGGGSGGDMMDKLAPPREMASDETVVPDSARFKVCNQVLTDLAARTNSTLSERKYSMSKRWGLVARANAEDRTEGVSITSVMICWSKTGATVRIAILAQPFRR